MGIYEELRARGLIAQVTDEEEIRELINNGKATFYIGFDPTADSLHVGQQADRSDRRRHGDGRRPVRENRYAPDDDRGNDPTQL